MAAESPTPISSPVVPGKVAQGLSEEGRPAELL